MADFLAVIVGGAAGVAALLVLVGLAVSVPILAGLTLVVLLRRQGVPLSYNLRSLARRKVTSMATLIGLSLVVFVTTAALMLASGIERTLTATGHPLNAKILNKSTPTEGAGYISLNQIQKLSSGPELAAGASGASLLSPELVLLTWGQRIHSTDPDEGANITLRGVTPLAFDLHAPQRLEGRLFAPGTRELVIGKALVGRFEGAILGGTMRFADRDWQIVGIGDHGGSAHDSELWGDYDTLSTTFRRGHSSATLRLTHPDQLTALSSRIANDPELSGLEATREASFWKSRAGNYVSFVTMLGIVVGTIFSLGAVLGAMNTMYAQVSSRTRELATLRAIGYKPRAVLTSIVAESLLLGLAAGVLGIAAAAFMQQVEFRLTTNQTLAEMTYRFHLTPSITLLCLSFAALMGYAGGLLPALKASRMPLVDAIRAD